MVQEVRKGAICFSRHLVEGTPAEWGCVQFSGDLTLHSRRQETRLKFGRLGMYAFAHWIRKWLLYPWSNTLFSQWRTTVLSDTRPILVLSCSPPERPLFFILAPKYVPCYRYPTCLAEQLKTCDKPSGKWNKTSGQDGQFKENFQSREYPLTRPASLASSLPCITRKGPQNWGTMLCVTRP